MRRKKANEHAFKRPCKGELSVWEHYRYSSHRKPQSMRAVHNAVYLLLHLRKYKLLTANYKCKIIS